MKIREFVEEWDKDLDRGTDDLIQGLEFIFKGHMTGPNEIDDKRFWERAFLALMASWDVDVSAERADEALEIYRERRDA